MPEKKTVKEMTQKKKPAPSGKKMPVTKKAKQTVIDLKTGELVDADADETGMTDRDLGLEDDDDMGVPTRESQGRVVAELVGIVMKPGKRVFTLKTSTPKMIDELSRIYQNQKAFLLKMRIPTEVENGKIKDFEDVEFPTNLIDISLKAGSATCHGSIDHKGAMAMSNLIQNWTGPVQFFLDGIQQSLI